MGNGWGKVPFLDYGSAWMSAKGYTTTGGDADLTSDYYQYDYLYGTAPDGSLTNLLENNYQPGENVNDSSDDWVLWQWWNAQ